MSELPLPRTIDELPYLFVWRLDDFLIPAAAMAMGFVAGMPLRFALAGLVLAWIYRKHRGGKPELFVVHWLYWRGLYPGRGRSFPNALQRCLEP
jgi:conjugal transfer pilus assembly protein TraL